MIRTRETRKKIIYLNVSTNFKTIASLETVVKYGSKLNYFTHHNAMLKFLESALQMPIVIIFM